MSNVTLKILNTQHKAKSNWMNLREMIERLLQQVLQKGGRNGEMGE